MYTGRPSSLDAYVAVTRSRGSIFPWTGSGLPFLAVNAVDAIDRISHGFSLLAFSRSSPGLSLHVVWTPLATVEAARKSPESKPKDIESGKRSLAKRTNRFEGIMSYSFEAEAVSAVQSQPNPQRQ